MQFQPTLAKLLLSVAVAGAFAAPALAQTSVSVEGIVDAYVGSMKNSGDNGRKTAVNSGGMTTSFLGFKGVEDLGGGLKANFTLGAFFQTDTGASGRFPGDSLFARDANVGLSGNFGAVTLGRSISPVTLPVFLFNPLGDSFTFSPLVLHAAVPTTAWAATYANSDTGWSNTIRYTTQSFGGLTADLYYQFGEAAADASKKNFGGNLLYFRGPLSLTLAYHDVKAGNPIDTTNGPSTMLNVKVNGVSPTEQKLWLIGGAYEFSFLKLYATYDQAKHDVDVKDRTASLGLSVPTGGAGKVLAEIAQTRRSSSAFAEQRRTTYTIGYDYNLSKRTDAYAMVMNDKVSGFESAASAGVGVRHKF
jgi:predicted porin